MSEALRTALDDERRYADELGAALMRMGHHNEAHHQSPDQYDDASHRACGINVCLDALPRPAAASPDLLGWLRDLTDGSPWAEDHTCIGCGKREYRVETSGHREGCAYVAARSHLAAAPSPEPTDATGTERCEWPGCPLPDDREWHAGRSRHNVGGRRMNHPFTPADPGVDHSGTTAGTSVEVER